MVPLFGFMLILSSLVNNFSSKLIRRGAMAGLFAALAIMSHTLNMLFLALSGACILCFAIVSRRSEWRHFGFFIVPASLVSFLAVFRYVQNYFDTGSFMGYGLQYSIYKGTWVEAKLGQRWTEAVPSSLQLLETLFIRYDWVLQVATVATALLVALLPYGKGKKLYLGILIGIWASLLISVSNVFDYTGINLSNALIINARYPLPFFVLSAPLLAAGVVRLLGYVGARLHLSRIVGCWIVVCLTAFTAHVAYDALQAPVWRSNPKRIVDKEQIWFLGAAVKCLGNGQNWLVDDDVWNVYFNNRPPVFLFTLPARPLLVAQDEKAASSALTALNIQFAAFIYKPGLWHGSPIYAYIKSSWVPIIMSSEKSTRELWASPEVAGCIKENNAGTPKSAIDFPKQN